MLCSLTGFLKIISVLLIQHFNIFTCIKSVFNILEKIRFTQFSKAVLLKRPSATTLYHSSSCSGDPSLRSFSFLLHNCNFDSYYKNQISLCRYCKYLYISCRKIYTCVFEWSQVIDPVNKLYKPQRGCVLQVANLCCKHSFKIWKTLSLEGLP